MLLHGFQEPNNHMKKTLKRLFQYVFSWPSSGHVQPTEKNTPADSLVRFGLPKGGHCPPGQVPGKDAWAGGCTWSVQKRLKTIHQARCGVRGRTQNDSDLVLFSEAGG